jgi:hypothetical protein
MAQQFWHFNDQAGFQHTFGIYHGEESGHFVAYLDDRVMLVDFEIYNDKSYHFYFERELLELKIEKKQNGYLYFLHVDTTSNTALNLEKKQENRLEKMAIILVLTIMVIVLIILFLKG